MAATNRWDQLLEDSKAFEQFSNKLQDSLFEDAETALSVVVRASPGDATTEDVIADVMDVLAGRDLDDVDCEDSRWFRLMQDPDALKEVTDEILRLLFENFEAILADLVHEYAKRKHGAPMAELMLDVLDGMEDIDGDALDDLEDLVDGLTFVPRVQS